MKKVNSHFLIFMFLVIISLALYFVQLNIFHSPRDTAFYILQDIAFLPLQVALVTVVLGKILKDREKSERLKKIDMVISAFFSEAGTEILVKLTKLNTNYADIRPNLAIQLNWNNKIFSKIIDYLKKADLHVECNYNDLESLKFLLIDKRDFLIHMLENPNLLEHDTFTDMLLAVFHITEELIARDRFLDLKDEDIDHLASDIKRALRALLIQWTYHTEHLSTAYPYLYSLEVRRNPFSIE